MKDIYLDNAATSFPKPACVGERVLDILTRIGGNPGRASHRMALEAGRVIFSARESLARLVNVDSSRIVFTKNATEAVNIALKGLLLSPGDHVVTTSFEHNSVAKTLRRLAAEGVEVTKVCGRTPGLVEPGDIEKAITRKTKLVTVVHASNVLGTIQPVGGIGALCREKGIPFMVDGAQTIGAMPVDLGSTPVDMFVGTGHKALLGPQGTGFMYLRDGVEPPPLVDGGTGAVERDLEIPERLEAGTMNTPGIGGLGAGVEFVLEKGLDSIRRHDEELVGQVIEGLRRIKGVTIYGPLEPGKRTALVAFNMDGVTAEAAGVRLDREFSIFLRCGFHCAPDAHRTAGTSGAGSIRVSPGYFNTPGDIDAFLSAVSAIAKG